ncbi:glycosyltransferase family 2 protein [Limosilactobacillus reuteri subsp. suis]|uniref:glycosyltransferase family 2 protein n=1 Tax=Limosilactobacillus reuteri TaxID=1598 RepID=UPI003994B6F0
MQSEDSSLPQVSIVVPVYNSERFLDQCLASLKAQTLAKEDLEVLIINDGSTDGSQSIINKYVSENSNFRVIEQKNAGLFAARKTGINNAKGRFVGWVDSDDFVEPTMFKTLFEIAQKKNSDLVYCDYEFYPKKIGTKAKWFREYKGYKDISFIERNSQPWNKLVSRDLLEKLDIADLFLECFDEAYIKCLLYAKNPISIDKSFYYYRVGNGSMSSSYNNVQHYKNFINSSKNLRLAMNNLCQSDEYWKEYFDFRIIYYKLLTLIIAANSKDRITFYKLQKEKSNFKHNKHFKKIMIENYGLLKYFVMVKILPLSYHLSALICRFAFN